MSLAKFVPAAEVNRDEEDENDLPVLNRHEEEPKKKAPKVPKSKLLNGNIGSKIVFTPHSKSATGKPKVTNAKQSHITHLTKPKPSNAILTKKRDREQEPDATVGANNRTTVRHKQSDEEYTVLEDTTEAGGEEEDVNEDAPVQVNKTTVRKRRIADSDEEDNDVDEDGIVAAEKVVLPKVHKGTLAKRHILDASGSDGVHISEPQGENDPYFREAVLIEEGKEVLANNNATKNQAMLDKDYYSKHAKVENFFMKCTAGGHFNKLVSQMSNLVNECTLIFTVGGIQCLAMNESSTCMMHVLMPPSCFHEYKLSKGFVLDVNMTELAAIHNAQAQFKEHTVSWETKSEDSEEIFISFSSDLDNFVGMSASRLLTFEEHPRYYIPSHTYDCILRMDANYFMRAMLYLSSCAHTTSQNSTNNTVTPNLQICISGNEAVFITTNEMGSKHKITLKPSTKPRSRLEFIADQKNNIDQLFCLNTVTAFARSNKVGTVTVYLCNSKPLVLEYVVLPAVGDDDDDLHKDRNRDTILKNCGSIRYVLAAKMEEEEIGQEMDMTDQDLAEGQEYVDEFEEVD